MTSSPADETSPARAATPRKSILAQTAKGAGWTIGWRFATRLVGFCSTFMLVRLLTPEDFGIVSLATGFFEALDAVTAFGVEGAIIRVDRADRAIYDAGFTINVCRGAVITVILLVSAVPVAGFFGNAHLTNVIYVMSAGWAISSLQNVGMIEFRRSLAFDKEFKIQIIPRLAALAVTIPAAFVWHSYWALAAGIVSTKTLTVILSYVMHPYRPRLGVAGMAQIFGFSFWEWMIGLLSLLGGRADTLIIGRLLGAGSVGVYGVGGEIASLPSSEIVAPLCRALFSGFVAERREGTDGSATLLRVLAVMALLTFPLSVGLSLVAYPVIKIGFGVDWLAAVPLVQVLGVSSAIGMFSAAGVALFSAHAWLRTILWITAIATTLRITLLLLLIPKYGLLGGACAAAVVGVVQETVYLGIAMRRLRIRVLAVLASVFRPLMAVACMAAILAWSGLGWSNWDGGGAELGLNLASAAGLGAIVYCATLTGLWFVMGWPAGAEADLLSVINRVLRRA